MKDKLIEKAANEIFGYITKHPNESERYKFIYNVVEHVYNNFLQSIEDDKIENKVKQRVRQGVISDNIDIIREEVDKRFEERLEDLKHISVLELIEMYTYGDM